MSRDPSSVPCTYIDDAADLPVLQVALAAATHVAIDTETPVSGPQAGQMRVMSVATRAGDGDEQAFVVDARTVDSTLMGCMLEGVTAVAWNANFDARVVDLAVWKSKDTTPGLVWWDAQLADALIYQGRSGFTWFHGLAWATEHYLGIKAEGKGTVQLSYTADDDLSADQIAYAAADAVETLWVADAIRAELARSGLEEIAEIEMAARPFLDQMERTGLPFDWDGWQTELAAIEQRSRNVIGRIADLTGGGQGTLFDDVVEPNWNPSSDQQVREALNTWSEPNVLAWTESRHGTARHLVDGDSVNAGVLREIGGDLCEALLEFRNYSKTLSTYGESIHEHLHDDGRLRPQYLQVVGTNTGRLASRNPNAQNFSPLMKPYFRSPDPSRVFVHADLSQAELRYLAQVADDEPLRAAFAAGVDVHVSTAASMFGFDPDELLANDPDRFKKLRQTAKALNFGIAYGAGAGALARTLTGQGTPTTREEGAVLLDQYRKTYPGTAAWAEARIAEIEVLRGESSAIDWEQSLKLARSFTEIRAIRREFRATNWRWPAADEIAELHSRRVDVDWSVLLERIEWVLGYSAPVALMPNGEPFMFACRTSAGRRQQFNLHLDRLFLFAALDLLDDTSPTMAAVRDRFANRHSVVLSRPGGMTETELARVFEDRSLRRRLIEAVGRELGTEVAHKALAKAARERVGAMVNAWRNAPIQGGVADIMLAAYADLAVRLRGLPSARPVQTVHDSVVIECDRSEAQAVADQVRAALDAASVRFCPDVTPKADVDIRISLADADVLDELSVG